MLSRFTICAQPGNAGTLRTWCKLEDLFAHDAKEKAEIKLQIRLMDMQEVYLWDASASLSEKEFELDANDLARTKQALTTEIHRGQERVWLEPLLGQLEGRFGSTGGESGNSNLPQGRRRVDALTPSSLDGLRPGI